MNSETNKNCGCQSCRPTFSELKKSWEFIVNVLKSKLPQIKTRYFCQVNDKTFLQLQEETSSEFLKRE